MNSAAQWLIRSGVLLPIIAAMGFCVGCSHAAKTQDSSSDAMASDSVWSQPDMTTDTKEPAIVDSAEDTDTPLLASDSGGNSSTVGDPDTETLRASDSFPNSIPDTVTETDSASIFEAGSETTAADSDLPDSTESGPNTDSVASSADTDSSTNTETEGTRFLTVDVGDNFACGLTLDGTIACWGDFNADVIASPPSGQFVKVTAGKLHACALDGDGRVLCWGENYFNQSESPAGTFTDIASGSDHSCGVVSTGEAYCWGDDSQGQSTPAQGQFDRIFAQHDCTCGLRTDGSVDCWGDNSSDHCISQAGPFKQISIGGFEFDTKHTCGILTDDTVLCWGDNPYGQGDASDARFVDVSAGGYCTYGIRLDGAVDGFGLHDVPQANRTIPMFFPEGVFTQISSYNDNTCALRNDGAVVCWQDYDRGPPA